MQSRWEMADEFEFLRAMGDPLLVMAFLTCAAFATSRRTRCASLIATELECVASACFIGHVLVVSQ
jgi:hypothetical protein